MTPEGKVKAQIKVALKGLGAWYCMPVGSGFGRVGIPDFVGVYNGKMFAIEAKAGNNVTTALQARELERINAAGGFAIVVNEDNIKGLGAYLKAL